MHFATKTCRTTSTNQLCGVVKTVILEEKHRLKTTMDPFWI